jgi:predicted nucleic acid-binding Zn ribbon protein
MWAGQRVCSVCGRSVESRRADARVCSSKCRQALYRSRVSLARARRQRVAAK